MATVLFLGAIFFQLCHCIKMSVGIEHDLSRPTYGLEGKSSSQLNYDDRNGLKLGGTLNDILGPPIKIANGLGNLFKGSNLAGIGGGLRGGGALLGFDAKLLETAGAGNMFKGGLMLNGLQMKHNLGASQPAGSQTKGEQQIVQTTDEAQSATKGGPNLGMLAAPKGQKIASIIELPVKVVAMKDLMTGKALSGVGQMKGATAQAVDSTGQQLMAKGQALKSQGISQILQGATEGVQNLGNMFQKTSQDVNSAIKLFPLVWDMQQQESAANHEATKQRQQQQQHLVSSPHQLGASHGSSSGLTGGSLFGGLLGGLGSGGGGAQSHDYAAVSSANNPLLGLLTNPAFKSSLLPLEPLAGGPLGQALGAKLPMGSGAGQANPGHTTSFILDAIPGIKYSEQMSFSPNQQPRMEHHTQTSKAQAPIVQQQQQQQQQNEQKT